MPRNINNWTYNDVATFLREKGFQLNHTRGSHHYFTGVINKEMRHLCVPRHGNLSLKPRTMKSIILQAGIEKESWFENK